jgi:hypothetical protein
VLAICCARLHARPCCAVASTWEHDRLSAPSHLHFFQRALHMQNAGLGVRHHFFLLMTLRTQLCVCLEFDAHLPMLVLSDLTWRSMLHACLQRWLLLHSVPVFMALCTLNIWLWKSTSKWSPFRGAFVCFFTPLLLECRGSPHAKKKKVQRLLIARLSLEGSLLAIH